MLQSSVTVRVFLTLLIIEGFYTLGMFEFYDGDGGGSDGAAKVSF